MLCCGRVFELWGGVVKVGGIVVVVVVAVVVAR